MQRILTPDGTNRRLPTLGGQIMLVGFVLMGGVLSLYLVFGILALQKGLGYADIQSYLTALAQNPANAPGSWYELMTLQAVNHLGTYFLPALAYWYFIEKRNWQHFNARPLWAVGGLGLVVLIVLAFTPFDGLIIEWNQNLHLPQTLAPLEQWMRDQETKLSGLTKYLTTFRTTGQFLVAMLVIAIIPAIGEETLFRGVLQRNFSYWTGNVHVGIWVSAVLFSAIHVQFLGFFPRMLLGALFGYLYVWSGNLWVPILAHFVNNGFMVLMIYLHQQQLTTIDVESNESVPVVAALVAGGITAGLLYYFKQINEESGIRGKES